MEVKTDFSLNDGPSAPLELPAEGLRSDVLKRPDLYEEARVLGVEAPGRWVREGDAPREEALPKEDEGGFVGTWGRGYDTCSI